MTLRITLLALLLAAAGLLLRRACRYRLPARMFVVIWDIVLVRLLIPADMPIGIGISFGSGTGAHAASSAARGSGTEGSTLIWIWAAGAAVCLVLFIVTLCRENRILRTAARLVGSERARFEALIDPDFRYPIYISEAVSTPVAYGFFRRRIVLPRFCSEWNETTLRCVLMHEAVHLKYQDPLHKFVAALIASLHWFSPASWIACLMLSKDLEAACDEKTIALLGEERRTQYASALVDLADQHRHLFAGASGFGCGTTKERILGIMKKKQLTVFIVLAAVLVTALAVTVFAADPADAVQSEAMPSAEEDSFTITDDQDYEATFIVDESGAVKSDTGEILGYISDEEGFSFTENGEGMNLPEGMHVTVTQTDEGPNGAVTYSIVAAE